MWTGVAVAGVEAMLQGIGWVIDHGSQAIKRPKISPDNPPPNGYLYSYGFLSQAINPCWCNTVGEAARSVELRSDQYTKYIYKGIVDHGNYNYSVVFDVEYTNGTKQIDVHHGLSKKIDPNYQPTEPEYEYLSDSALGNEIIGNGENTQPLPAAVQDAYSPNNPAQSEPAPQATQDALDNANPQPETEPTGETKPKPNVDTDGDGAPDAYDPAQPEQGTEFQLPNFCSWAPAVCDFFTVQKADNKDIKNNQREQIEQDKTFFEKVREWFDWSQADDELPNDATNLDIGDLPTPELQENAISWGSSCPADVSIPISMQGVSSTLVFSWSPWCQLLSIIKPAIIASAYIGAAFIVLGLRT